MNAKRKALIIALKYGFSLICAFVTCMTTGRWKILPVALCELALIWSISNALLKRVPVIGHIAHFLLLFLFNVQMLVMYFGNSYITLLMLTNLISIQDLSGNFDRYLLVLIPLTIILLLPMPVIRVSRKAEAIIFGTGLGLWLSVIPIVGIRNLPLASVGFLTSDGISFYKMRTQVVNQVDADKTQFYRAGVDHCRAKPESLVETPNVIMIFVEGLSQSVIEDARGVMPNLSALEQKSLCFENYYNHAFATYRGLIGQLYSGFQLSDLDSNQLVSLQGILHDRGYETSFINTEPYNEPFTKYLESMAFDDFISNSEWITQAYMTLGYIVDQDAYEHLLETAREKHSSGKPFFTAMYSLGTHASFDSPHEVYGDGSDAELNKFYNLDVQLGRFMERFDASELAQDTVVVITTDHATYQDQAFNTAFPDYHRYNTELDRIPLMIYYAGMEPERIDAGGRNSLDLAPTILDYLNISEPNYFLGLSLFGDKGVAKLPWDCLFFDGMYLLRTDASESVELSEEDYKEKMQELMAYFSVKGGMKRDEREDTFEVTVSDDCAKLTISSGYPVENGKCLWFAVWGAPDGQNDTKWYRAERGRNDTFTCVVPLREHREMGMYQVDGYVGDETGVEEYGFIDSQSVYVKEMPPGSRSVTVPDIKFDEERDCIDISVNAEMEKDEVLRFAVWGQQDGQNDLVWYRAEKDDTGQWYVTVDRSQHGERGIYCIHMYIGTERDYGECYYVREYTVN